MQRKVRGERKERWVTYNGNRYQISINWHLLDNGDRYNYIHVNRQGYRFPIHRWAWVTESEE